MVVNAQASGAPAPFQANGPAEVPQVNLSELIQSVKDEKMEILCQFAEKL